MFRRLVLIALMSTTAFGGASMAQSNQSLQLAGGGFAFDGSPFSR